MIAKLRSRIPAWALWAIGGVVAIAGVSGGLVIRNALPEQQTQEPELQTTTARLGDLVLRASGSGSLMVAEEVALGFGTAGTLEALYVQVGDEVQAGDVLAIQGDREQLEAAVASDELALLEAQQGLEALIEDADLASAQAQLDLAEAQDALNTARYTWTVQQEGNRASDATLDAARAELVMAEQALELAKAEYDKFSGRGDDDPQRARALASYANAQQRYDSALRNWNWYTGHPTEIQQALLDADMALAEARLADAEREFERLKNGPDPEEVDMAELQVANAQARLAISQRTLEAAQVVAPIAGTVLEVQAQVGETVSGPFITLADLSQPHLEVFLDETDLDGIDLGYPVEVVFDALPDLVFTGQVIQVDPSLYTSGGVSTVRALAQLDPSETVDFTKLPVGLSASVDVIGGQAQGVTLVPVEALRELSPGEYAVFVVEAGDLILRPVQVGLRDFTYAEIVSGLQPGEVVSTGIVETE